MLVHAGVGTYLGTRGGDYSGISVDPVDGTFWAANEFSRSSLDLWGTWVANFSISATAAAARGAGLAPPTKHDAAGANAGLGSGGWNGPDGNADADFLINAGAALLRLATGEWVVIGDPHR